MDNLLRLCSLNVKKSSEKDDFLWKKKLKDNIPQKM